MTREVLFGYHPVREALRHRPHRLEQVLVASGKRDRRRREIEELCARHRVELAEAGPRAFADLGGAVHNGFLGILIPGPAAGTERPEPVDPGLVVLVEDVRDPRNLGALLRVCEGAGVGRVAVRDRGSAPLSSVVAKTSAGAMEWLAVERVTNTGAEIGRLKEAGFWVYGAAAEGRPPWEIELTGSVAFCIGGEESGLRKRTRELCDELVGLPMRGRVGSLNLATAAAAILYEAVRQRSPLSPPKDSG